MLHLSQLIIDELSIDLAFSILKYRRLRIDRLLITFARRKVSCVDRPGRVSNSEVLDGLDSRQAGE